MKIAFVNGKGGVGKTTVSLMLAATFHQIGQDVSIEDRDPQQSATILAPNLSLSISTGAPTVIIDTAPRLDHRPTLDAIRTADLVVLISSPSPADLASTVKTAQVIQENRNSKKLTRVLFNSVQVHTRLAHGLDELRGNFPFPVVKNHLSRRQAYQLATLYGWKELNTEAREEILKVAVELLNQK
ncbi:MAG: ParA family protein [Verrucomicrobiae bacterium]|nr:ParA family protein [Verrucomicrobiae bacterium]